MRIAVTGRDGQVARALRARAGDALEVTAHGRPEFDLAEPEGLRPLLQAAPPDVVVSCAAYTAVDKAEMDEAAAMAVNGRAPGVIAAIANEMGIPVIQISTDYVFDGASTVPYVETDATAPINVYGHSKLAGEEAVAAANPRHAILRTSWVYDGEGKNFLTTMLRLAGSRDELGVVADQFGAPTYAADIADAVIRVAANLCGGGEEAQHGVFHMTGGGRTSWAGFAEEIFKVSAQAGGPSAHVRAITTADYPTPARRPANSSLNCDRLAEIHGVRLPAWDEALRRCMATFHTKGIAS